MYSVSTVGILHLLFRDGEDYIGTVGGIENSLNEASPTDGSGWFGVNKLNISLASVIPIRPYISSR